jgi:hypothetical protein
MLLKNVHHNSSKLFALHEMKSDLGGRWSTFPRLALQMGMTALFTIDVHHFANIWDQLSFMWATHPTPQVVK